MPRVSGPLRKVSTTWKSTFSTHRPTGPACPPSQPPCCVYMVCVGGAVATVHYLSAAQVLVGTYLKMSVEGGAEPIVTTLIQPNGTYVAFHTREQEVLVLRMRDVGSPIPGP